MAAPVQDVFYANATAKRIDSDVLMYQTLKKQYPSLEIIDTDTYQLDLVRYVRATGDGTVTEFSESSPSASTSSSTFPSLLRTSYVPAATRSAPKRGELFQIPYLTRYTLSHSSQSFIVYQITTRDGASAFPSELRQYILTPPPQVPLIRQLLLRAGNYATSLHNEIWIFDQGYWQKSTELYSSIQKSRWEDIILPQALKEDILDTITRFYSSRDTYKRLRVPWKRGLIFYGPPGNGKTVSIKATMKTLLDLKDPIPTLYVKSLVSFAGSEASITAIFKHARSQAPCYLVFEDLDSMITDNIRSFFLNAVDGINTNDGVLMIGSTNHLDRLDPGIAKRPSRFDRKYEFGLPGFEGRKKYAEYWRRKLQEARKDERDTVDVEIDEDGRGELMGMVGAGGDIEVDFPHKLCSAIANLTKGFSFAYMQEAFISALLNIVTGDQPQNRSCEDGAWDLVDVEEELNEVAAGSRDKDDGGDDDSDLEKYVLYREIKKQIKNLRKEFEKGGQDE